MKAKGKISLVVPGALSVLLLTGPAVADQCINDDLIVDGSTCIGLDCRCNGEVFSFDTLRLKENNLRITFIDTSVAASFPRGDWQIRANDSANGGANKLVIDWLGTNAANGSSPDSTPFTIEGTAPSHSLFVQDNGNVGFGTSVPSVELHVVDGNTPTLRLAQDGSAGFEPQTWDLAGNETNFFVRDVTNGSALPFRIRPGAPSNSIFVHDSGDVGLGTSSPDVPLHVLLSGAAFNFNAATAAGIQNTANAGDGVIFSLIGRDNSQLVFGDLDNEFAGRISYNHNNDTMRFFTNGAENMTLDAAGNLVIIGTCTSQGADCATDYVFDADYPLESIEEHAALMWEKSHLPGVGPTPDNDGKGGRIKINVFQKTTGILQELEKAHIYIEQLHQRLATQVEDARQARETDRSLLLAVERLTTSYDRIARHNATLEQELTALRGRLEAGGID